ncbi:MAG: hypothetical protein C0505_00770 [Leptothrix sp. (in: Bacteria)]|nr:hypothetical protein [Leptothrix sp. (in: b-proteobacteria)]
MKFQLPWRRGEGQGGLVLASHADALAWVRRDGGLRCGLELRGSDSAHDFERRLRDLGLPATKALAVLPLHDSQLVQVDAPAVQPEELKAAARWSVKELVEGRVDELTMDVMPVGDDRARPHRQIFVAAARNSAVREIAERTKAAGLELEVIDIAENAQRNLLSAVAESEGLLARATAALMLHGEQCLLTICAGGELYYARRLDWDGVALAPAAPAGAATPAIPVDLESMDFIDYGAADDSTRTQDADDAPRLVIDLQRSLDVWERSWPELPLAGLWVQLGPESANLAGLLERALGLAVHVLDPERVFPGFEAAAASPAVRQAVLPLLGALLRTETRKL